MVSLPANSSDYTGTIHGSSLYVVLSQSGLYALLALLAIAGNGLVIFLFIRHKTLRNVPNYLIVDLSVVDFFNSVVNIPFAICPKPLLFLHRRTASGVHLSDVAQVFTNVVVLKKPMSTCTIWRRQCVSSGSQVKGSCDFAQSSHDE